MIKQTLSVKYIFMISQETNGRIMISKIGLKSDVLPGTDKCGSSPKLYNNDLKTGRYRVPKLPPLYVKHVCSNSQKTNHPNVISKIVLKSVL